MKEDLKVIHDLAKKYKITIYKEYIKENQEYDNVYIPVFRLKNVCDDNYLKNVLNINLNQNEILAARIYKEKFNVIDAKPFFFRYSKRNGTSNDLSKIINNNKKAISKLVLMTSFLNKDKSDDVFDKYFNTVCDLLYDFNGYEIDREMLADLTIKGRNMSEKDIVFQQKKFKFVNGFDKAPKKVKMKIVNQGLYWDDYDEIHSRIKKAIYYLLETDEFIHSGNISKIAKVKTKDAMKYRSVFKDLIDAHNKSKYETDNYKKYINNATKKIINSTIAELEREGKKTTNVNIAKKSNLHINTVSKNRCRL